MQVVPVGHVYPHMPQLVLLVWVFWHEVPPPPPPPPTQRVWPVGQVIPPVLTQLPLKHTCVLVQARPHMPQLMLLTCVLTQSVPQRVVPIGQAVEQVPATHD